MQPLGTKKRMKQPESTNQAGFPARFNEFMKEFKLNPNKLSVELNESNPVKFRRWASGEISPSYEGLVSIASQYGINMNWFVLGEGPMLRGDSPKQHVANMPLAEGKNGLIDSYLKQLIDENKELKSELKEARIEIREAHQNYHGIVKPEFSGQTPVFSPFQVVERNEIGFHTTTVIKMHAAKMPFVSMTVNGVTRLIGQRKTGKGYELTGR